MSKMRVIVLSITHQGLTKQQAAEKYNITRRWIDILLNRYQTGGLEALEPRKRTPKTNPRATPPELKDAVKQMRYELESQGLDAGPISIHWNLQQQGLTPPSTATIKATPIKGILEEHYRVRYDRIDTTGKVTLRRAGVLHKLGVGRAHATARVVILVDETTVTITHRETGEILGEYQIEPTRKYWPKK